MRRMVLILLLIAAGQTGLSVLHADDARLEELKHRLHTVTFSATPPPTPAEFNAAAAKTFNVTARSFQFDFSPSPFVVNRGDSVTLNITVPAGDASGLGHGFFLEQFATQGVTIGRGQTVTVNFIASTAGTFLYACSLFCGDGHGLMFGTLIVNEVLPAPTIASFTPTSGPPAGGTVVVITGANFQNGLTVRFGETAGIGTSVDSATRITTFSPVHAAGAVTISVTNPDGQSATSSSQFTYAALVPAPSITSFTPTSGPPAGGTLVVITGANFQNDATVRFGDNTGIGTSVESATRIATLTPAQPAGAARITVANPDGQSVTSASPFIYTELAPAPSITSFTPTTGSPAGGTVVVITGASFQNGLTVRFGQTAGIGTNVDSATRITTLTPVHAAGAVTISVTNPDGQSATSSSQFNYVTPAAPIRRRAVKR